MGRALKRRAGLGPGQSLSPSLKAGPRTGPAGLAGLAGLILLLINPKNINLTQNSSKVNFLNFIRMLVKYVDKSIKDTVNGLGPFAKSRAKGSPKTPGSGPGPGLGPDPSLIHIVILAKHAAYNFSCK